MRATSFPCLVCGAELVREDNDYEAQPRDGVMCETHGNYGSRVLDCLDGSDVSFNICDGCFTEAGEQGRLFMGRGVRPVKMFMHGWKVPTIVGWQRCPRSVYVPWREGMEGDGAELIIDPTEDGFVLPENVKLNVPLEDLVESPRPDSNREMPG